jgi:hypothetical protein
MRVDCGIAIGRLGAPERPDANFRPAGVAFMLPGREAPALALPARAAEVAAAGGRDFAPLADDAVDDDRAAAAARVDATDCLLAAAAPPGRALRVAAADFFAAGLVDDFLAAALAAVFLGVCLATADPSLQLVRLALPRPTRAENRQFNPARKSLSMFASKCSHRIGVLAAWSFTQKERLFLRNFVRGR